MSSTHPCPIRDCTRNRLMLRPFCMVHWSLVPAELKREVLVLWHTKPISEAYMAARKRAIAAVEDRLAPMKGAAKR